MATLLADVLRAMDIVTPQMRIERWCVLDMVENRWEPLTDWLTEAQWVPHLQALTPYKLYRMVSKHPRRALEIIPTPDGKVLQRTDGRSWVDPPEWKWEIAPESRSPLTLDTALLWPPHGITSKALLEPRYWGG